MCVVVMRGAGREEFLVILPFTITSFGEGHAWQCWGCSQLGAQGSCLVMLPGGTLLYQESILSLLHAKYTLKPFESFPGP